MIPPCDLVEPAEVHCDQCKRRHELNVKGLIALGLQCSCGASVFWARKEAPYALRIDRKETT
jgi:hypothetical protein